ncbi:MAG: hypothetical protein FWB96_06495 [Defluviitaleaceae bacterium]|nr:hypothetical protein [Defluviitaleaceae bacterium]MCL2263819.1 hypothetical protein [Defluviitaleaceae bacterium]
MIVPQAGFARVKRREIRREKIIDTTTEQLLALESEAQEAMNDIAKESAHMAQQAQETLTTKIAAIENDGAETIRNLVNEAETHTAARIALVNEEYRTKSEDFKKVFEEKKEALRGKIFHDVLYGGL